MFPPGMDPKKMMGQLKRMGIDIDTLNVTKVVLEFEDGKKWTIENPEVMLIKMKGTESLQIIYSEKSEEEEEPEISEEDIKYIMENCEVDEATAKEALIKAKGDIAQAIDYILSKKQ